MIKLPTVFVMALVAMASGVLFHTSYGVRALDDRLSSLNREIMQEKESIRVLRAEWAYLNQPSRLRELAAMYSRLVPVTPDQIIASVQEIPAPLPGGTMIASYPLPGRKPTESGPVMVAAAEPQPFDDEPPASGMIQTAANPLAPEPIPAAVIAAVANGNSVDVLLASFRQQQDGQEIAR